MFSRWCQPAHRFLLSLGLAFLLLPVPAIARAGASGTLESLGFTLLQAEPIDFELPRLEGAKQSLRGLRGKWIWLAFWASWCGPCVEELPVLEKLHRELGKSGLAILAVSVDQDRSSAESFARDKGLTLPILLDTSGSVAAKYRASALPTLYVISPDWKLAGILQGAKNWDTEETRSSLKALLRFREYDAPDGGIKMVDEGGSLSLPNDLAPPELSVSFDAKRLKKGETAPLTVFVTWKGNPKDYLIGPPKVTLPEGVTQGEISSSSTSENESTTLSYRVPLTLPKEGSHKIGPIEMAYSPRRGGKELFSRHEGLSVDVEKEDPARTLVPAACALGFVLMGGFLFWYRNRRPGPASTPRARRDWSAPFESARQLKMKGERQQYAAALLKLALQIDEEAGARNAAAAALLEKVEFGGHALSEAELAGFEKRVEKALKESS